MFANNPVIHISIGLFLGEKAILISVVLSYPTALSEFCILYHDAKYIIKTQSLVRFHMMDDYSSGQVHL